MTLSSDYLNFSQKIYAQMELELFGHTKFDLKFCFYFLYFLHSKSGRQFIFFFRDNLKYGLVKFGLSETKDRA